MISGNISGSQDLIEVLSTIPRTKRGYLSILSKTIFLALNVENGRVKGFFTNYEINYSRNPLSLLIFVISEMLYETEGYFSLEDETAIEKFLDIDADIESVVIQATILRREIEEVIPLIITTNVRLTSESNPEYDGKLFGEILANAEDPIEELRKLKDLLERGLVHVKEIKHAGNIEEIGFDYILDGVDISRVNVTKLIEGLKRDNFNGYVEINKGNNVVYLFFKEGKVFGVSPAEPEIFDTLLDPLGNAAVSIVRLKEEFVETFAQIYIGKPSIASEDKYLSLGKLFITLISNMEDAVLKVVYGKEHYIFIFNEGRLLSAKRTNKWTENFKVTFPSPNFIFLYRNIYASNIVYTFYLFLLNKLKNILVRWNLVEELNALYKAIAHMPSIYIKSDSVYATKSLTKKEEKQLMDLFVEISDRAIERLGKEEFEREMELELSPYKEVLKVLDITEELYREYEKEDNLS